MTSYYMSPTYVIKRETQKKGISYRTVEEWPMEVLDSLFSPLPSSKILGERTGIPQGPIVYV